MANDIFKVLNGFGVYGASSILSGAGAPGGDSSFQDAAAQGSLFLRTDSSSVYLKTGTANSTADWVPLPTSVNSSGIAPANAADSTLYANVAAAQTAYDGSNTVDGISISAGFRILLTNLTSGSKTVYVVSGSSGSWTLTADGTFTPAAGDECYVESGNTYGGDIFTFDGTNWNVQSGTTVFNELGYIRTFIGKSSAGSITPTYSSNYFVTNGTSLETAIGAIDTGLQAFGQSSSVNNITSATTVDSVNCRTYNSAKWFVTCVDHSTPSNKQIVEIFAVHDATNSADAVNIDFNVTSILSVNTAPNGLTFTLTLSGTGASQVMNLRVSSTTAVDVKVARIRL